MSERVTIAEVGELESRCRYGTEPASLMLLALRVARAFLVLARAAEAVAALFKQPNEGDLECFERIAAWFYRETGVLRPGKDSRDPGVTEEKRRAVWVEWYDAKLAALRAALPEGGEGG